MNQLSLKNTHIATQEFRWSLSSSVHYLSLIWYIAEILPPDYYLYFDSKMQWCENVAWLKAQPNNYINCTWKYFSFVIYLISAWHPSMQWIKFHNFNNFHSSTLQIHSIWGNLLSLNRMQKSVQDLWVLNTKFMNQSTLWNWKHNLYFYCQ